MKRFELRKWIVAEMMFYLDTFTWHRSQPLTDDSFILPNGAIHSAGAQVIGLAIVTTACVKTSPKNITKQFILVAGAPVLVTMVVYAVIDPSKFQGYSTAENPPLSNWGGGSFGLIDFSQLWKTPSQHWFYIVRTFSSVIINICSILLVLIDAVCLEVRIPGEERRVLNFLSSSSTKAVGLDNPTTPPLQRLWGLVAYTSSRLNRLS